MSEAEPQETIPPTMPVNLRAQKHSQVWLCYGRLLLSSLLAILVWHPGGAPPALEAALNPDEAAERWAAETLAQMSLEEKIGQMLMVSYYGGFTSAESPEYQELMEQIEKKHVGGFVVRTRGTPLGFDRSYAYPTAALANQLQKRSKLPLLVAADFERGTAMRLVEGTSFPQAMGVAATGNPADAYTMGKITALEARAVGVHWVFAPVADVNVNPQNPIINIRSFGEDPQKVAEFAAAYVRGVEENGALSTAKHFPGHGDTSVDSHVDLPTVPGDRQRLEQIELLPFRAALAAGTSTVMTGHLAVPALEPDTEIPATLSPRILGDLLRKELGFDGIVVTDALDMGGVTVRYPPAEVAVRSILAGADMLLIPPIPDAALAALKDGVESGRLPIARVDEAVRRILRAKARLGLHKERVVDLDALNTKFGRPEFAQAAQDIADRGVTLLRDRDKLLPLDATRPMRVLLAAIAGDADVYPGEDFERELRWRVDALQVVRCDTRWVPAENVKLPPTESYDVAIAALFVRVADRKGSVGLPEKQAELVRQLLSSGKPVIVVGFGSPYLVERFPDAPAWLGAFSTVDVAQRAAARALFGQVAIGGHIPVTVPNVAKLGDGLSVAANPMTLRPASAEMVQKLDPAFAILERAVESEAFPGGVLAVGHRGELVVKSFGRQTYEGDSPAVTPDTLYDAASVTKPVVTATLLSLQVAAGRINLDAPVVRYLPEFAAGPNPEWRKNVTVRHLLTHSSGLPTYKNFALEVRGKREVLKKIFAEPILFEPGTWVQYSDLGFILLGEIVERFYGKPLDVVARERLFAPLGMANTMFNPPAELHSRTAPTEDDRTLRQRVVRGEVHDENAWAMGGVAGHAGMFTTAGDLAIFAQMMLNGGIYAHQRVLRRTAIEQFTARLTVGQSVRALGWGAATPGGPAGKFFSQGAYGHTGFTGTSLFIDPAKELFVVLLTNRVHPTRENVKIDQVRPAVHDAVVEALGLANQK